MILKDRHDLYGYFYFEQKKIVHPQAFFKTFVCEFLYKIPTCGRR